MVDFREQFTKCLHKKRQEENKEEGDAIKKQQGVCKSRYILTIITEHMLSRIAAARLVTVDGTNRDGECFLLNSN